MNHRVFSKAEKLGFIFLKVAQLIQESSVQTCHNVRVRSATQWTSSVHTLHMSKLQTYMITFVLTALCAMLILVPKSQIPHTPKKDAKTSENTDVSNVHFLLQIAYESHDH